MGIQHIAVKGKCLRTPQAGATSVRQAPRRSLPVTGLGLTNAARGLLARSSSLATGRMLPVSGLLGHVTSPSRLIGTYRGSRDDSFGLHSQASFNTGSADAV
jgi:hypothetical protein